MRKTMDPEKLRTMIRSILPSTWRDAGEAKSRRKRAHRHAVRVEVRVEDPEETAADFFRDSYVMDLVYSRRGADKLNHFMRWCEALTEGMSTNEALGYVRGILPQSVIGDHAYSHWETHCKYADRRERYVRYAEERRRAEQSRRDSAIFRLRRALREDPTLHGRLNAEIKSSKLPDEPRRLLMGEHDVEAFIDALRCDCKARKVMERLIEEIEKGGREAALRISGRFLAGYASGGNAMKKFFAAAALVLAACSQKTETVVSDTGTTRTETTTVNATIDTAATAEATRDAADAVRDAAHETGTALETAGKEIQENTKTDTE